ncbi:hypothetical protein KR52_03495 [Synechococcus sp. KORDI-52]|nr:hypothetical protein KR52_03495 [Synechococcus sp. KORDI-52]
MAFQEERITEIGWMRRCKIDKISISVKTIFSVVKRNFEHKPKLTLL